jgi:catechol 2,3-dioxygenase-like lactoylglutathione lyase family enzyme
MGGMITGIDHIVILVRDLDAAMEDYARLGFTVMRGGDHPGGTHNALIAFADGAYLELIAFKEPDQPSTHPWQSALAFGEGLVALAVGSSDLAADVAAIRARGLPVEEPSDGSRLRPDGVRLAWRSAGAGPGPRGRQRPFLIEDVTPREQRVATGRLTRHASGVVGVVDVTLAVADLNRAAADLAALLDVRAPAAVDAGGERRITFPTPRGALVVAQGIDEASPLRAAVAARGEHVFAVTLGTMPQGGEPAFAAERAHGANLRFVPV